MLTDTGGREILAGDTLYNPFDENKNYTVLSNESGELFLGDFDSPLERFAPSLWWTITNR